MREDVTQSAHCMKIKRFAQQAEEPTRPAGEGPIQYGQTETPAEHPEESLSDEFICEPGGGTNSWPIVGRRFK